MEFKEVTELNLIDCNSFLSTKIKYRYMRLPLVTGEIGESVFESIETIEFPMILIQIEWAETSLASIISQKDNLLKILNISHDSAEFQEKS